MAEIEGQQGGVKGERARGGRHEGVKAGGKEGSEGEGGRDDQGGKGGWRGVTRAAAADEVGDIAMLLSVRSGNAVGHTSLNGCMPQREVCGTLCWSLRPGAFLTQGRGSRRQ